MKIRSAGNAPAGALVLLLALGAAGCGGSDNNANNTNAARNANANSTTAATPMATPTPVSASEDNAIKNKTEAALSKAGVSGVTVEVKEGVVTLKGEVPEAKRQAAMQAANESGAKRVMNQMTTK